VILMFPAPVVMSSIPEVCCSGLLEHCVAVCCAVLHCLEVCCTALYCVALGCSVLHVVCRI